MSKKKYKEWIAEHERRHKAAAARRENLQPYFADILTNLKPFKTTLSRIPIMPLDNRITWTPPPVPLNADLQYLLFQFYDIGPSGGPTFPRLSIKEAKEKNEDINRKMDEIMNRIISDLNNKE